MAAFPLSIVEKLNDGVGGDSMWFSGARVMRIWSRALRMVKVVRMNKLFQSLQNNYEFVSSQELRSS